MREPDVECAWGSAVGLNCDTPASLVAWHPGWRCSVCTEHAPPAPAATSPLLRDPRIACLVAAAITGAAPHDRVTWEHVQACLREAFAGNADAVPVAIDAIEEAGLHEPEAWPTVAGVIRMAG